MMPMLQYRPGHPVWIDNVSPVQEDDVHRQQVSHQCCCQCRCPCQHSDVAASMEAALVLVQAQPMPNSLVSHCCSCCALCSAAVADCDGATSCVKRRHHHHRQMIHPLQPGCAAAAVAVHLLLPNCPDAVAAAATHADGAWLQPLRLPADDDALRYDGDSVQQPVWNLTRSSAERKCERERKNET